jgi:outer membrane protein TolC
VVDLREALRRAYIAGATDVHIYWRAGGSDTEPDFAEAAGDYATAALSAIPVSGEVERLREALAALLDRYTRLVNSGDAGFWDPEEEDEVKLARQALNSAPDVGA